MSRVRRGDLPFFFFFFGLLLGQKSLESYKHEKAINGDKCPITWLLTPFTFNILQGGKLGMNEFEIGWSKPNVSTLQMCYKVFRNYACFVTEFVAVKSQELDYSWALP